MSSEELARYSATFTKLATELDRSLDRSWPTHEQARFILAFLHRRLLTGGYDAACHDPRRAFDRGEFNCVGSTLLFHCLAAHCGLESHAMLITGHVWCRVDSREHSYDVETTNDRWRPEDKLSSNIDLHEVRALDTDGMVALVYYNRSVVELEQRDYLAAIEACRAVLELDAEADIARDNLTAAYNNWAVQNSEEGHHPEALKLLAEARAIAPHDERLKANARRLYARSYEAHLAAGEYLAASEIVAAAVTEFPDDDYFVAARSQLLSKRVFELLQFGNAVPLPQPGV
ncbi:MAG: tetratricopeptide repeat protein [Pirellulales bacterium]|nr:tetratricopeptide repeat protein [Pirellulales bacterium]